MHYRPPHLRILVYRHKKRSIYWCHNEIVSGLQNCGRPERRSATFCVEISFFDDGRTSRSNCTLSRHKSVFFFPRRRASPCLGFLNLGSHVAIFLLDFPTLTGGAHTTQQASSLRSQR